MRRLYRYKILDPVRMKKGTIKSRRKGITKKKRKQKGGNEQKKFAFIVRGEGFRRGGQDSRNHGSDASYDEQKAASKTHMDLVKKIESKGYAVDIFLDTYHTKFDDEMKSWYGVHLKKSMFHPIHLESQNKLIEDSVKMVRSMNINYDVIYIMRTDLYLKELYINTYNPDTPTVQFVSIVWKQQDKTPKGNPRINGVIFHFPKRFFDKIDRLFNGDLHNYLDDFPLQYEKEYSLLTDDFHDSNSAKDFNPYYKMTGRGENPRWHSEGKKFPRNF